MIDRLKRWELPNMELEDVHYLDTFGGAMESVGIISDCIGELACVRNIYLMSDFDISEAFKEGKFEEEDFDGDTVSNSFTRLEDRFDDFEDGFVEFLTDKVLPFIIDFPDAEDMLEKDAGYKSVAEEILNITIQAHLNGYSETNFVRTVLDLIEDLGDMRNETGIIIEITPEFERYLKLDLDFEVKDK